MEDHTVSIARIEEGISHLTDLMNEIKSKMSDHSDIIHELKTGNEIQKQVNTIVTKDIAELRGMVNAMTRVEDREGQHAKAIVKWVVVIGATTVFNQIPNIIALFK